MAHAEEFTCEILSPEGSVLVHSENGVVSTKAQGWYIFVFNQSLGSDGVTYESQLRKGSDLSFSQITAEGLPFTIDGTGFSCCPDSVGMNCAVNSVPYPKD